MQALRSILIYHDIGCSAQSTQALKAQLEKWGSSHFNIRVVDSQTLRQSAWEKETYALAIGGGSCSIWEALLQEEGMRKIHDFVVQGGRYLGICAGAYFGAAISYFQEVGKEPLEKRRPLGFYPGLAVGPIYVTSDYLSPQAALALKVELASKNGTKEGYCYYQGGPAFDVAESSPFLRVLLKFDFGWAGGISSRYGLGKSVMCGLHPEFIWEKSLADGTCVQEYQELVDCLHEQEGFREEVWQTLMQEWLSD